MALPAIEAQGRDMGINRTPLYDARKTLGVLSEERPDGDYGGKVTFWRLPGTASQS
jgi:hypothetical protein